MKYTFLLFFFLFIACKNKTNEKVAPNNKDSLVTIVFKKRSYNKDTIKINKNQITWSSNKLNYSFKDNPLQNELVPNNQNNNDTIVIKTKKDIILSHPYYFYFKSLYIFKPGDIVVFDYPRDAPLCTIINRNSIKDCLNFNRNFDLSTELASNQLKFYNSFDSSKDSNKKSYYDQLMEKKLFLIKSLLIKKRISKASFELLESQFQDGNNLLNKNIDLSNINYRNHICEQVYNKYKVPNIKTRKGYGSIKDFRALFDSIANDKNINKKNKNYLLYNSLLFIAEDFLPQDFELYNKKFMSIVRDSILINDIKRKYLLDYQKIKKEKEKVYLNNYDNKSITLDEIINKNKGSVVYVDFWASWCKPCREEMPFSKKLQSHYKDEKVKFVFISIDKNFNSWVNASKKEELINNNYSFISINYPNADFYNNLSLNLIPRYIIYDKHGKLVDKDAPRPSNDFLIKELDKYLEK